MQVVGYGTMIVKAHFDERSRQLVFPRTAYGPMSKVTMVSVPKLKRKGIVWNMHTDTLEVKATNERICDIIENMGCRC